MNESIRPSTYSIAWIPSVLLRQIEKNHQDERRIESIERAGNRDRALLRWTRDYPEAKNRWIGFEPYGIILHAWSVVWRGTSRRSVHSDNVRIRFDAGSLNAGWKVKTQAGWKQKRMGPVGCFGQIENIKRQSLTISGKNVKYSRDSIAIF